MQKNLTGQKIKNYQIVKFIGKGQFAHVYKAIDQTDKKAVAMKVMLKSQIFRNPKRKQLALAQIKILKQSTNPNIIKYYESFQNNQFLFIITQYCNGGDLSNLILEQRKIPQDQAITYLKQIVNGFKGLRQIDAVHRDFKAANVLLHDNVCKLADFGVSKQIEDNQVTKTIVGTVLTSPPQLLQQKPYGIQADIWSIGVVFYQMIYGDYPYVAKSDTELLEVIKQGNIKFHKVGINQKTKDFIQKCLIIDPKKRISWEQIFEHPLIGDKEKIKKKNTLIKNKESLQSNGPLPYQQQVNSKPSLKVQNQSTSQNSKKRQIQQQQMINKSRKLYENKINDILFVDKFIQPSIQEFQTRVRLNHSTLLFLLYKNAYMQLVDLQKSLQNNKNIFNIQNHFESFVKTKFYKDIQVSVGDNILKTKNYSQRYKSLIKISSLQIQNQFDLAQNSSHNLDLVLPTTINQYTTFLEKQTANQFDEKYKKHMINAKDALIYYYNTKSPNSQQYSKNIQNRDPKHNGQPKKRTISFM